MSKSLEKKKATTKRKQVVKEKSEKVEKVKESKIKKLTKKQLIIIGFVFAACILVAAVSISLLFDNKESKTETKTCLVQFNTNGGLEVEATSLECGGTINEPEVPYKSGFDFLGWYSDGKEYDFKSKIDSNIILEAKWKAKEDVKIVVVSFDTDGGSKQNDIELEKGTYLVKPVDPTKNGYTFVGWYFGDKEFSFISKTIDENIVLKAKWKKEIKKSETDNTQSDKPIQNENNKNDDDEEKVLDVFHEYDDIVNKYLGVWYLSGYEDIYLNLSRYEYTDKAAMKIQSTNFGLMGQFSSLDQGVCPFFIKYPASVSASEHCVYTQVDYILYNEWNSNLKSKKITLKDGSININGNVFVRNKGSKNIYSGTMIKESIGTWYLYNQPNSYLKISLNEPDNGGNVSYCIHNYSFNIETFETNKNGFVGCDIVPSESKFKKYGITISNDVLTINNGTETRKFYKTKKYINVSKITLNYTSLELIGGDSKTLSVTITPSDAYDKNVTWTSSNTSVVTVNSSGKVTAKGEGTATITATTSDGGYTAKCIVTVIPIDVNSISLNKTSIELLRGNSETLTATISPSNATNKNVTWSSSDTSVATVSSSGKVTAKGKGTATITATTKDGGYTAKCVITVSNPSLTAKGSIGIKTVVSSTGATKGIVAEVNASGGTGTYTYFYIKLYKDGTLIGSTTNTSSNELFITGYTNGSYTMEYEVRDSDGTIKKGTSSSTISGF